jgi:pyruvate-ferredoxin/flavodoxin oxidoreductase
MLQTVRAFNEAESYDGPSLIIAYSPCIAHGYNLRYGIRQQKLAVDSGAFLLYRFNPSLKAEGKNPLSLDCKEPSVDIEEYMYREIRFRSLRDVHPDRAAKFLAQAQVEAKEKYSYFKYLADRG